MFATREEVIASIIGDPNMKTINWQSLMRQGVKAKVSVGRTRFVKKLRFKDIGIVAPTPELQKRLHRAYSLGSLCFLPEKYRERLDSVQNRAYQSLEEYAMRIPGLGWFVPVSAYESWRNLVDDLEKEYYAIREELLDNYESARYEAVAYHLKVSNLIHKIYEATAREYLPVGERESIEVFRAKIRERMLALFPSRKKIEESFRFVVETTYIDFPSLMKEEEFPLAKMEITPEMLEDEKWQIQRQKMLQEMNKRVVADEMRDRQRKINEFLDGVIGSARQIIYEKCLVILGSIQEKGNVSGRASKSLATILKTIKELNFYGDRELDQVMNSIDGLLAGYQKKPELRTVSVEDIQQALRNITIVTRSTLLSLNVEERGAREDLSESDDEEGTARDKKYESLRKKVGIPEEPTFVQQRQARMSLKMAIPAYLDKDPGMVEERGEREKISIRTARAF